MNKKILIAVGLTLAVAAVFSACKKEKKYEEVGKITGDDGKEIVLYTDEEGSTYVENANGEKVPVTSDPDGFYDDLNSVVKDPTPDKNDGKDDKNEPSENEGDTIIIGDDKGDASIDWNEIGSVS